MGIRTSATCVSNHSGIYNPLNQLYQKFSAMWRRKAFLNGNAGNQYYSQGLEENDFIEAENTFSNVLEAYAAWTSA